MLRLTGLLTLVAACSFTAAGGPDAGDGTSGDDAAPEDGTVAVDAAAVDAVAVDAVAVDAVAIDAPPPCPATYINGYRYVGTQQTWRVAEADCEDDSDGLTHLVVLDNDAERIAINTLITSLAGTDIWVGIMRDPPMPWVWRQVTGGPASYLPWEGDQPDNQSGDQQVVTLMRATGLLRDVSPGTSTARPALCECDRRPPTNADYADP
ncbi:MAG: C-type lectin domain-containing protein [Myxococcales bacterium]|nr:C-type lectin domain-containing protein [Myxococcales bacterium]